MGRHRLPVRRNKVAIEQEKDTALRTHSMGTTIVQAAVGLFVVISGTNDMSVQTAEAIPAFARKYASINRRSGMMRKAGSVAPAAMALANPNGSRQPWGRGSGDGSRRPTGRGSDDAASFTICGKTGTSLLAGSTVGWFGGYAPAAEPEVIIVVGLRRKLGRDAARAARVLFQAYFAHR